MNNVNLTKTERRCVKWAAPLIKDAGLKLLITSGQPKYLILGLSKFPITNNDATIAWWEAGLKRVISQLQ